MSIDKALEIASAAHAGQVDKAGEPYINHPIAVAAMVEGESAKIVALLHDVVEDTDLTFEDLRQHGISDECLDALERLTHRWGDSYSKYIDGIKGNRLARVVKLADLKHNSDLSRIANPTKKDLKRVEKYKKAIAILS